MKLSKSFCITKKAFLFVIIFLCFVSFLFITSFQIRTHQQPVSSRAAPSAYIGGEEVTIGEYPTVAYLSNGCTGVLIHPRLVLTAAHCAVVNNIFVVIGIVNKNEINSSNMIDVENIITWNFDDKTNNNDIALLLLRKEVRLSTYTKLPEPITDENLYEENTTNKCEIGENNKCVFGVGWGCSSVLPTPTGKIDPKESDKILEKLKVPSDKLFKLELPIGKTYSESMFYVGYTGTKALTKSSCSGDSGSPLFSNKKKNVVVGILWGGYSGFSQGQSSATRVINFTKRIKEEIIRIPTLAPTPTIDPFKKITLRILPIKYENLALKDSVKTIILEFLHFSSGNMEARGLRSISYPQLENETSIVIDTNNDRKLGRERSKYSDYILKNIPQHVYLSIENNDSSQRGYSIKATSDSINFTSNLADNLGYFSGKNIGNSYLDINTLPFTSTIQISIERLPQTNKRQNNGVCPQYYCEGINGSCLPDFSCSGGFYCHAGKWESETFATNCR